MQNKDA